MRLSTLLLVVVLIGCSAKTNDLFVNRQAAEFEEVKAVWLIWPPTDHKRGESVQDVTITIIENLLPDTEVVVTCGNAQLFEEAKAILNNRFKEASNLTIELIPSVELWARDMGPVFVETNNGKQAIADFNFNAWGYSDTLDTDTKIEERYDVNVAELLQMPTISSSMISEGGNREVNGKGTLLVTARVEEGRNPTMTRSQMEAEYKRLLGVKKVIWLQEGLYEDDHTFLGPLITEDGSDAYTVVTTDGHIDEFARFVNDSTILLGQVDPNDLNDPIAKENHRRMEENYQILSKATDQDNRLFTIIRMPLPKIVLDQLAPGDYVYDYIKTLDYQDGSRFPESDTIHVVAAASYLNFLITNTAVLGQKYWREGLDDDIKSRDLEAEKILTSVFPNRKVIMLDALAVNLGGGGIHCITMQQPETDPYD